MTAPIARVLLRYGVGCLAGLGLMHPQFAHYLINDPELQLALQGLLSGAGVAAIEGWYALAKRYGWET
ncbi:hypothetical protein ACFQ3K_16940 [Brucella gallinifaecis]|uniref:hypothetical protein n=1 Tax=Brucella gallinifaecis TaxID=215590 RepID=UPI00130DE830|nr:hypothetical protein [Brucella gallinifaecis]